MSTILFDYGNVLFDIDIPGARRRLEALRHPALDPTFVREKTMALISKYEIGAIDTSEFVKGMLDTAKPGVTAHQVVDAWNSILVSLPVYRLEMLTSLRENYKLYLLSNMNPLHLEWVNQHLASDYGITDFESRFLHDAFYSHLIGKRKPDPGAFQYVIDHTSLTPKHTLFIDDMEENLETAQRMGFYIHHSPAESEVAEFLKEIEFY